MNRFFVTAASVGYIGYIPIASGTFGTIPAIPLYWIFGLLFSGNCAVWMSAVAVVVAITCWIAGEADEIFEEHDSHKIVLDEVAGYMAATMCIPFTMKAAIAAFIVFRVLDVIKPFPAGWIDRKVPGGPGVVLDDVVSGLYSNVVTLLLLQYV